MPKACWASPFGISTDSLDRAYTRFARIDGCITGFLSLLNSRKRKTHEVESHRARHFAGREVEIMPTKAELEERNAALQAALEQACDLIHDALGIEEEDEGDES